MKKIFVLWLTLSCLFALCNVVALSGQVDWTTASILKVGAPSLLYMFLPAVVIGLVLEVVQRQKSQQV
ncbi:hypothetical protein [Tumebacillus flagellatus]|uniref:Uncharacterized protein n=1 Tax=Tumebacillus flagellatus TaxID=1157490 RepID=A0A074MD37_9BACL|nr:hypothetical protein [Tumebacillus flagellatus]KEO83787.1 hypothetical protein EL26_07670 [Tumebacillus flagellatus]